MPKLCPAYSKTVGVYMMTRSRSMLCTTTSVFLPGKQPEPNAASASILTLAPLPSHRFEIVFLFGLHQSCTQMLWKCLGNLYSHDIRTLRTLCGIITPELWVKAFSSYTSSFAHGCWASARHAPLDWKQAWKKVLLSIPATICWSSHPSP